MYRIVITGAGGFVASHLIPCLQERQHTIVACTHRQSLSQMAVHSIRVDLEQPFELTECLEGADAVVHLAALAHVVGSPDTALRDRYEKLNFEASCALAEQAKRAGVKHFIFMSSIKAMCESSTTVLNEASPTRPSTAYGTSKLKAEQALTRLAGDSFAVTIFRPCLVYGPRNLGNMRILVRLVKSGVPLPFGAVKNRRSLLGVNNLVEAITVALGAPQAASGTFVLSDGEDISIGELITLLSELTHSHTHLLSVPERILRSVGYVGDTLGQLLGRQLPFGTRGIESLISSMPVDCTHYRERTGWRPNCSLREGLRQAVEAM